MIWPSPSVTCTVKWTSVVTAPETGWASAVTMRPAGAAVVVVGAGGLAAGVVVLVVEVGPAVVDVGASVDVVVSGTVVAGTLPAARIVLLPPSPFPAMA